MINLDLSFVVTILYVIVLYIFMSHFFFGPITHTLKKRRELIDGRLEEARKRIQEIESKAAEYEQALRKARSEAYRQQELQRQRALQEKAELVSSAKSEAARAVHEGRAQIASQAAAARKKIETEIETFARKLAAAVLKD